MSNLFVVGEYVEKHDGSVGVVQEIGDLKGRPFYRVRYLQSPDEDVLAMEVALKRHHRIHAHMDSASQDCDGKYESTAVCYPTISQRCSAYGDLEFKQDLVTNTMSVYGVGTLHVTPDGVIWSEKTEEGYRYVGIEWCEKNCAKQPPVHRDFSAEKAGY